MSYDNVNFDFDTEGMTQDEIKELIDSTVFEIAKQAEEEDNQSCMTNPEKLRHVILVYKTMSKITKGIGVKISYRLNKPFKSMASVSVEGKGLVFSEPELFACAAKLASNLDVYPKTNGCVKVDFTFHGMTIPIDVEEDE